MNRPAMNGRVINGDAALIHHLLKIPQAEIASQIPTDAQQDHRTIKMTAFEHYVPPERAGGVSRTELLKVGVSSGSQTSCRLGTHNSAGRYSSSAE